MWSPLDPWGIHRGRVGSTSHLRIRRVSNRFSFGPGWRGRWWMAWWIGKKRFAEHFFEYFPTQNWFVRLPMTCCSCREVHVFSNCQALLLVGWFATVPRVLKGPAASALNEWTK